jgi:hypothetical protein
MVGISFIKKALTFSCDTHYVPNGYQTEEKEKKRKEKTMQGFM